MNDNITIIGRKALVMLIVVLLLSISIVQAFGVKPSHKHIWLQQDAIKTCDRMILKAVPPNFDDNDSDTMSEEQQQRNALGRSDRRRVRTLPRDEDDADNRDNDNDDEYYNRASMRDTSDQNEDEYHQNRQFGYDRSTGTTKKDSFTEDADAWDGFDDNDDDDDENEDFDIDETRQYDLLENIIIPNPLLDSMDPDGTVERLPELLSDPKFWFDMVLFVLFLDFLSFAGPQSDPFIDFPWIY
jgi:hypothetical protein